MKTTLSALALSMGLLFSLPVLADSTFDSHVHPGGPRGAGNMYAHEHADYLGFGHPGDAAEVNQTVVLSAGDDMAYTMASLHLQQGDTVRFTLTNTGTKPHELFIADEDTQRQLEQARTGNPDQGLDRPYGLRVQPGQSKTVIWRFDRSGSFQLACHLPGSYRTGMIGQITVTPLPKHGNR